MDDTTLAKGLGLTDVEAAVVIPKLSPQKRATYERLIQWSDDWNRYWLDHRRDNLPGA